MSAFLPVPNRVAFSIFGIDIMWYGVLIGIGMILGVSIAYIRCPRHGLDKEKLLDLAIYCIPFGVIGARAYYVLFQWDYYKDHLSQIPNIRGGGLAIHGGLIFGLGLAAFLLIKRWKQNPLEWMDIIAPSIALGQAIGRWGNYFNSEAHGGPTDLPWAIEVDGQLVHPTFLYESIWCLLLFIGLIWMHEKGLRRFPGQIFCLYLILYSAERFFVEGLRTDSLMIGPLRQAQVLSLCTIAATAALYFYLKKKSEK